ncbi:preprotein translocase, YajC subunit [Prevotella amnii]|jgi:preprotein translocase, yajC subunit|uniref:Sec translocon accessory complex subunit YajC n=2 Tax=Prevotella amnii TaxID=419005 RepID=A0A134BF44_9BACT|nr:preprotein translocase subunit YajC [Prevotella amnii]EFN90353.1 preprotein translocase, YajC subunit [Prevotella amnii CRIS 21A-A]KXB78564.1 preprotein translocase, YajC subunit [Prevotella amnii]
MNTEILLVAQSQGGGYSMIIMMVAIFVIMYFFMIRPQQKKQKQIRAFQNALKDGDSVVTGGGIYGIVKRIDLTTGKIDIEISKGVVITVDKSYVFADVKASQAQAQK